MGPSADGVMEVHLGHRGAENVVLEVYMGLVGGHADPGIADPGPTRNSVWALAALIVRQSLEGVAFGRLHRS